MGNFRINIQKKLNMLAFVKKIKNSLYIIYIIYNINIYNTIIYNIKNTP